jgi:tetratricopeptide (TPR) repeat protein
VAKDEENGGTPGPEGEEESEFQISPEVLKMAEGWFNKADDSARKNNYEYAINSYLLGLKFNLDDVERGHKPLFECALRAKAAGKAKGWFSKTLNDMKSNMAQMAGKKKDAFLKLEETMTSNPENYVQLQALAIAALSLKLQETPVFFAEQAFETARRAGKMTENLAVQAANIYEARSYYKKAMICLQEAEKLDKLNTQRHMKRIRDLAARTTIDAGLEEAKSAFDRVKDKDQARDSAMQKVRTAEDDLVEKAEQQIKELKKSPNDLNLLIAIGDTYTRAGRDEEAMQYYRKARAASGGADYRIKYKMDDLHIRQFRQQLRVVDEALKVNPKDDSAAKKRQEILDKRNTFELEAFTERANEYPTDMIIRYELGLRQYRCDQIDQAIGSFQLSTREPQHKVLSLNMLGKCFFSRKLYTEAAYQFQAAMKSHEIDGDALWKELRYNLGLTFEAVNQTEKAINCYSEIVMVDFSYRDAAKRLQELRTKLEGGRADGTSLDDGGL